MPNQQQRATVRSYRITVTSKKLFFGTITKSNCFITEGINKVHQASIDRMINMLRPSGRSGGPAKYVDCMYAMGNRASRKFQVQSRPLQVYADRVLICSVNNQYYSYSTDDYDAEHMPIYHILTFFWVSSCRSLSVNVTRQEQLPNSWI